MRVKVSKELQPVRDYLLEISRCEAVKSMTQRELERLEAETTTIKGVSYDGVRVQHSMTTPPTESAVIRLEDARRRYMDIIAYAEKRRAKIIGYIMKVPDPTYVTLLSRYYVDGELMADIAKSLDYSERHMSRMHTAALREFGRVAGILHD